MLAATGVWPAVPLTGYLLVGRAAGRSGWLPFPLISSVALLAAAGLAVWSLPLLGSAVAGVYCAPCLGVVGWGLTFFGSASMWRERHALRAFLREHRNTRSAWDQVLVVGVLAAAALYLSFPTESIYGGRDEGVYANHAIFIAHEGRLTVPYPWPADAAPIFADAWTGFPGFYRTPGRMTVQFSHLFPVWLAQAFATLGADGLFRLSAVFATLSLAVFYGVCRMAMPPPYAVGATLFLAFNPSQLWMARITLTEIFAQLLVWSSILLLVRALRDDRPRLARWAGIFVGCTALVRFDGLLLVPLLLASHAVFRVLSATNDPVARDRRGAVWLALYQTALPLSGLALASYAVFSAPYFRNIAGFHATKLAVATGAGALLLLATAIPVVPRLRPWLTSKPVLAVLFVALFAGAAYGYWLRPSASARPTWKYERVGLLMDLARPYRQDSLVNLTQYVSFPVIPAALAGWCLLLWGAARNRRALELTPLLVAVAGCGVVYLWDPKVHPDHFWAIRRFVPVVIPGFVLCCAVGVNEAARRLGRPWRRGAELVVVIFLAVFTLHAGRLIFTFAEDAGFFDQVQRLAAKLPADQLVVTHGYKTWVMPLFVAFGRRVVPVDLTTDAGRAAKEAWVARQLARGKPAYLLIEVEVNRPSSIKVDEATLTRTYTEPTTQPLPRKILQTYRIVELYKIAPDTIDPGSRGRRARPDARS